MFKGLRQLYSPSLPATLVYALHACNFKAGRYLHWFWTNNGASVSRSGRLSNRLMSVIRLLQLVILAQIGFGIYLIIMGAQGKIVAGIAFGAAVILSYP